MEVGDDQILEVGDDVLEVTEAPPAPAPPEDAEDLPVVEAIDVAEEPPAALAARSPEPVALVPPAPPEPEPVALVRPAPPEPEPVALVPPAPPEPEPVALVPPAQPEPEPVSFAPPPPRLDPEPPVRAPMGPPGPEAPLWKTIGIAPDPTPPPAAEPVPLESLAIEETPLEPTDAGRSRVLPGLHRVVLHTVEGQVMRGLLQDPDLFAASLAFSAQLAAEPAQLPVDRVRAIFFMLSPGEAAPEPSGLKVRVTFRDGRQVAGFSPDYDPGASGFFMIPADTRTNTARIWVYRAAVRQVSVS